MWAVLAVLCTANLLLLFAIDGSMFTVRGPESAWEAACFQQPPFYFDVVGWTVGIILALIVIWMCCSPKLDSRWPRINQRLRLRSIFTMSSFSIMWVLLGLMAAWRFEVGRVAPKTNNKDQEWTFGQVLALAAWVPTFRELAIVLLC